MKNIYVVFFMCLILGLMSCSSITIKSDYDREVNFSRYQSFKWMPFPKKDRKNTVPENSILDKRIRRAIERTLRAKGFEVKERGKTDALLAYHVGVRQKVDVTAVNYGYWRGWPRGRRVYAQRYREGTLILDIVDPELKQLVWRGWAIGVIGHIEESEKKINESVVKILEKYPPQ